MHIEDFRESLAICAQSHEISALLGVARLRDSLAQYVAMTYGDARRVAPARREDWRDRRNARTVAAFLGMASEPLEPTRPAVAAPVLAAFRARHATWQAADSAAQAAYRARADAADAADVKRHSAMAHSADRFREQSARWAGVPWLERATPERRARVARDALLASVAHVWIDGETYCGTRVPQVWPISPEVARSLQPEVRLCPVCHETPRPDLRSR